MTRIAVIGHVEWVTFADGEVPALGADAAGDAAGAFLHDHGVDTRAARREEPQTAALTILSPDHERTIMVIGANLHPQATDDLGWDDLAGVDAVYFTGGDPATLQAARAAPVLVVTARRLEVLAASGVRADVLVGSANDPGERADAVPLPQRPRVIVQTRGAGGGTWTAEDGTGGTWEPVAPPGPLRDAYGAGDCFHAVLTASLGAGATMADALAAAARAGAEAVTRRGPYGQ